MYFVPKTYSFGSSCIDSKTYHYWSAHHIPPQLYDLPVQAIKSMLVYVTCLSLWKYLLYIQLHLA